MSPSTYELLPPIELSEQGLCSQTDPHLFISSAYHDVLEAKKICSGCPVRETCLEWAVEHKERYNVWGGVSERARRKMIVARHGEQDDDAAA